MCIEVRLAFALEISPGPNHSRSLGGRTERRRISGGAKLVGLNDSLALLENPYSQDPKSVREKWGGRRGKKRKTESESLRVLFLFQYAFYKKRLIRIRYILIISERLFQKKRS